MNTSASPIFLLNFIKKVRTKIDCHFILKNKDNFQVFTSKPINGIKCHKISDSNIKSEPKPQFLADNVTKFDSSLHKLTQTKECHTYYDAHRKELFPFVQKLESLLKTNE